MVKRVGLVHPQRVNNAMAIIASQYRQRWDAAHAPPPRKRQRSFFAAARATCVLALMLLILPQVLTGCAHLSSPSLISLDGSPIDELSQVASYRRWPGSVWIPGILCCSRDSTGIRWLPPDSRIFWRPRSSSSAGDGTPCGSAAFPMATRSFHSHPLLPQRISCYQIDVALD